MKEVIMDDPCYLNGFAFIEFSSPNKHTFDKPFQAMGFQKTNAHIDEAIYYYQQGNILFIVNEASSCQASQHAKTHGSGACAMGFLVNDAKRAFHHAVKRGATPFKNTSPIDHGIPAIEAIGGSVIYFVDKAHQPFATKMSPYNTPLPTKTIDLLEIDHLTHNVFRGNMDKWADFYQSIFNFSEIRYFDIKGKETGLISRAMASPGGKIKIPLNESKDDYSQIEEFLEAYRGEGIQHIALSTSNIYQAIHNMRKNGIQFLQVPDTYYEMVDKRITWHQEPLTKLQQERILIDGESDPDQGLLLQLFTENLFGPVFFEFIQRKGNEGFGEGNFQALFEAMERDQILRGKIRGEQP